jgi:hypothetical protein
MKRFFLLAIIILLSSLFIGQLLYRHIPESDPLELVDKDCGLLIDMPDAASVGARILHSRFGQNFTSIDWPYVFDQLEVSGTRQKFFQENIGVLLDLFSSPLWKRIFGKRIILALLPPEQTQTSLTAENQLIRNVVFIGSPRVTFLLNKLFSSFPLFKGELTQLAYRGRELFCLQRNSGGNIYYAIIDGHVIAAPAQRTVERSLDLSLRHVIEEHTGLITNSEFQKLRKRYKGDDIFVYVDIARFLSFLPATLHKSGRKTKESPLVNSGMSRLAFFHAGKGHTQRLIIVTQWDAKQLTPFEEQVVAAKPGKNMMLPEIPSKLVLYFWSNWFDAAGWWHAVEKNEGSASLSSLAFAAATWIEENSGLGMDEFVTLFGHNFGLNISAIRTSGFFPVPSVSCFIEVTDAARIDKILQKSLAELPLRRDTIAGIPVVSVMIADGLMQPSYALQGNMLMIADSREQIEELVDPHAGRLVNDALFKAVDTGMTFPSNLHVFARTSEIIESLKELASWGGTVIAIRDGVAGRKWKVVIDQIVLPLLDGLKPLQAKGVRGYTAPGEVIFDAVVQTADVTQGGNKH